MRSITGEIPKYAMMILMFLLLYAILAVYYNYKYAELLPAPAKAPQFMPLFGNFSDKSVPAANGSMQAVPNTSLNTTNATG